MSPGGPAVCGRVPFDIDRVLLRVAQSRVQKLGCPLAAGPIRNAENMESLLPMVKTSGSHFGRLVDFPKRPIS